MGDVMPTALGSKRSTSRQMAVITMAYSLVVLALYWDTVWSMVSIWNRSDTYAHGYLIVPISLWLVWNKRQQLACLQMAPVFSVLLLLIPGGLVWLLSYLTDVLVVQQLALTGILLVGIWSILGHAITRILMFPLGFLFLGVPMGEDLVPPMMEFTATSTVWLIKQTGIPVYREGLYFTLPSGNWSVVEACSGVRYLIASLTLGLLYAHLTYRSLRKQILFVVASALVPILANTARAYIIVMLGHLSGMTLATGVDHLVYGWVFFGLVMLILFWLGSYWRDDEDGSTVSPDSSASRTIGNHPASVSALQGSVPVRVLLAAVLMAGFWPLFAAVIQHTPAVAKGPELSLPGAVGSWQPALEKGWSWAPRDRGAAASLQQHYQQGERTVALHVQRYLRDPDGAELVSGKTNQFIDETQAWRIAGHGRLTVELAGRPVKIRKVELTNGNRQLQLWYWYRIGDRYTANAYWAKWYEAMEAISFGRQDSALIVLASEISGDADTNSSLQLFLQDYLPAVEASLDAAERVND